MIQKGWYDSLSLNILAKNAGNFRSPKQTPFTINSNVKYNESKKA